MKTNKIFSLLTVLVLGLAMVGLASAVEELDQYQTTGESSTVTEADSQFKIPAKRSSDRAL